MAGGGTRGALAIAIQVASKGAEALFDATPGRGGISVDSAELDASTLGNDGFLLWTGHAAGGAPFVAFTGSPDGKRGTLNAVYEFVEMLGIRFVAFDETTYPSATPVLTAPTFARIMEPQPQVHWRGMEDWPSFNHRIFSRRVRYVISGSGSGCPEGQIHTPLCEALYPPIYGKPANNSAGCARPRTLTLPL